MKVSGDMREDDLTLQPLVILMDYALKMNFDGQKFGFDENLCMITSMKKKV